MSRIGFVALSSFLVISVPSLVAQEKDEEVRLVWRAFDPRVSREFFQETTTLTRQIIKVMGTEVKQDQEQTFVMRWEPTGQDPMRNAVVTQEVVGMKVKFNIGGSLQEYDSDTPGKGGPLASVFDPMVKSRFQFTINRNLEVVDVRGHEELAKAIGKANPGMAAMVKGILSRDAMIQMLDPMLRPVPREAVRKGTTWKNNMVMNMGAIGTYHHTSTYTYQGLEKGLDRIGIHTRLDYTAPKDPGGELPFKIKKAEFRQASLNGFALFDRERGRIVEVHVKGGLEGIMTIEIGGVETSLTLHQTQETRIRTMDRRP